MNEEKQNTTNKTKIDSVTVLTKTYYVTVKNGHYELVDKKIDGKSFDGIMFWNKYTKTNYIIELTGDWDSVVDFTDNDENFKDNMAKLIECDPDELEEIDKPMVVYVIPDHGGSFFNV